MDDLNLTEEMILWAVWRLGGHAYGVTIRKQVSERTGRLFPYGTRYGVLAKLTRMGCVTKSMGDPSPVRGGRSRNYYEVTARGIDALKAALELKQRLWDREARSDLSRS